MIHRLRRPVRLPGRQHQLQPRRSVERLLAVDDRRPVVGRDLRAGRRRLHPGLRRAAADQLRALRDLHARHVRRVLLPRRHPRASPRAATPTTRASLLTIAVPGHRDAVRDAGLRLGARSDWSSSPTGRCARRNARSLTFLITAIGMSFVLQEFVHFILPQHHQRATAAPTPSSRSSWCSRRLSSPSSARRSPT